jgi:hypothetical protein
VLRHGWPSLRDSRGKVAILLDNDPGPIRDAYTAGRPNLEGRGAHVVSTDFPVPGMSARYDSDFVAELPGGGVARCNQVNAPRECRDEELEPRHRSDDD